MTQEQLLRTLEDEDERQARAEIIWLDDKPRVHLTGKDLLLGFGLVCLVGVTLYLLIVESFVQSGIR